MVTENTKKQAEELLEQMKNPESRQDLLAGYIYAEPKIWTDDMKLKTNIVSRDTLEIAIDRVMKKMGDSKVILEGHNVSLHVAFEISEVLYSDLPQSGKVFKIYQKFYLPGSLTDVSKKLSADQFRVAYIEAYTNFLKIIVDLYEITGYIVKHYKN